MNSINKIGVRIAVITLIGALSVFGMWKGISLAIAEYRVATNSEKLVSSSSVSTPTPSATLAPMEKQVLSAFVDTTKETLTGNTKKYIETLPAQIDKKEVLDPKKIETFVDANQGKLLPDLFEGTVKTTTSSGKEAIQKYLDAIAPSHNPAIKPVTGEMITAALARQENGEDPHAIVAIRASIEINFNLFKDVKAPKEAIELHTTLLQATLSLMNNVKLLETMQKDLVSGLIGQKNISKLNAVFTDIGTKIIALETKYNIK